MAKTRKQKQELLDLYKQIVAEENYILIKMNKVPADCLNKVRKELQPLESKIHVIKNKIFKLADEKLKDMEMSGNYAVIYSKKDIAQALKILEKLTDYAKEVYTIQGIEPEDLKDYNSFEYFYAIVNGQEFSKEDVQRLSSLPPRDVLLGQIAGTMANVITGFMNVLNGNTRKLLYALNDLKSKKE